MSLRGLPVSRDAQIESRVRPRRICLSRCPLRSLYWHAYSIRIYCIRARAPFTGLNEAFFNDPSGRTQHKVTIHKYDHLVTTQNDCWSIWQTRANAVFARRRRRIHLRFGVLNTPLHTLLHLPAHQTKVPNAPPFQITCLHWPCSLQTHPERLPGPRFTRSSYTISIHHAAGASPRDESDDGWTGEADFGGISGASTNKRS